MPKKKKKRKSKSKVKKKTFNDPKITVPIDDSEFDKFLTLAEKV